VYLDAETVSQVPQRLVSAIFQQEKGVELEAVQKWSGPSKTPNVSCAQVPCARL